VTINSSALQIIWFLRIKDLMLVAKRSTYSYTINIFMKRKRTSIKD